MQLFSGSTWFTNCPEAAAKLRAADERYERLRMKMGHLPLNEKIEAIRVARAARQAAYNACMTDLDVVIQA